ncbi:hypothetical protein [Cryptosporangium aurantiacum]|uniref:Uncharacterized protein n=1 Tax=Cryptosporangium aurantiacum TaxID=134849 RepID=A0A1M7RNU7_9ACTN|nr:hypothetical protein [Cryptosporangium aurantiacum]SHN47776.1 hypothetical protein SAMN05443668_1283 [Cryptosporangium aurantiacum]
MTTDSLRSGLTGVAVIVAIVLTGVLLAPFVSGIEPVGVTQGGHGGPIDLAVKDGQQIRTPDTTITVRENITDATVTEFRGGFLSLQFGTLTWIRPDASTEVVADEVRTYVVDDTGTRVVWRAGASLVRAELRNDRLVTARRTISEVPADAQPYLLIGDEVVLRRPATGTLGQDGYTAPSFGFVPWGGGETTWPDGVAAVAGSVLNDAYVLEQVRTTGDQSARTGCLTYSVAPASEPAQQRCDLDLRLDLERWSLSPSGRYFGDAAGPADAPYGVLLTVGENLTDAVWKRGPVPDRAPLWDGDTMVFTSEKQLYLWRPGRDPAPVDGFDQDTLIPRPFER